VARFLSLLHYPELGEVLGRERHGGHPDALGWSAWSLGVEQGNHRRQLLGDKVVTRGYFTGTHKGEFRGIQATGRQFKISYIDIWLLEGGKIVENWVQLDQLGLMQQIGAIPSPENASA
jgi:hypothetical protein